MPSRSRYRSVSVRWVASVVACSNRRDQPATSVRAAESSLRADDVPGLAESTVERESIASDMIRPTFRALRRTGTPLWRQVAFALTLVLATIYVVVELGIIVWSLVMQVAEAI